MGSGMFDGFGVFIISILILAVLGIWQAIEIIWWLANHLRVI